MKYVSTLALRNHLSSTFVLCALLVFKKIIRPVFWWHEYDIFFSFVLQPRTAIIVSNCYGMVELSLSFIVLLLSIHRFVSFFTIFET